MKSIDGTVLKQLFLSAANNLYNHYPEIDQLNVFPVPDGDTGMNMNLTLTSGSKEIVNRNDTSVETIAASFSRGLLMGARGNSGVITSQIFRGFADGMKGHEEVNVREFAEAFVKGKEVAYKAVMKPVEGTILTVIRESSAALIEHAKKVTTIEGALDFLLKEAKKSLEHTPDLLPILKEVGVVDSGGAGLCVIIEGMAKAAHGHFVERNTDETREVSSSIFPQSQNAKYAGALVSEDEEGFGYCTQFILRLGGPDDGKKPFIEERFRSFLDSHGKSVVMVRDEDIVKVHVHTLQPGSMLNYAQNYGEFLTIVIENMSGLVCPDCGKEIPVFGIGGGQKMCQDMHVPFLGRVPMEIDLREAEDSGVDFMASGASHPSREALMEICRKINFGTACSTGRDTSFLGTPQCSPSACSACTSNCPSRKNK